MSTNVEREEVQAILDLFSNRDTSRGPADVSQRDFRQPLRIAPESLARIDACIQKARSRVEQGLHEVLGSLHRVKLSGVREANAEGLFDDAVQPLAMSRFTVGGRLGWLVWQSPAAVAAVEAGLGARSEGGDGRELTAIERSMLGRLMTAVISPTLAALELDGDNFEVVVDVEDIGSWHDGESEEEPDPHRLCINLEFQGPGDTSTFHLYLPGFTQKSADKLHKVPAALPQHLSPVTFDVGVLLGESEISLASLLEIEVGDVIPLSGDASTPLIMHVEGIPCASGTLGTSAGRLALRIDNVQLPKHR